MKTELTEIEKIEVIIKIVADFYKREVREVLAKGRKRENTVPRQVIHFLANKYTKCSLQVIGNVAGQRDHATVLHSIKMVENLRETDKEFNQGIDLIIPAVEKKLNLTPSRRLSFQKLQLAKIIRNAPSQEHLLNRIKDFYTLEGNVFPKPKELYTDVDPLLLKVNSLPLEKLHEIKEYKIKPYLKMLA